MIDADQDTVALSVIMTVRNGETYIKEAIDSILDQTFADFEFIIVNNGSTDGTAAILDTVEDPRIKVITASSDESGSFAKGISRALAASRGAYFAIQDSDDISVPTRLEKQLSLLRAHPDLAFVASWVEWIDEKGFILGHSRPPEDPEILRDTFADQNPVAHSSIMFRRAAIDVLGGYDLAYANACDYALTIAALKAGYQARIIPEVLTKIRLHPDQTMRNSEQATIRSRDAMALLRRARDIPGISPQARIRNRRAITKAAVVHGFDLILGGNRRRGCMVLLDAIREHPPLAIVYSAYRVMRLLAPENQRSLVRRQMAALNRGS